MYTVQVRNRDSQHRKWQDWNEFQYVAIARRFIKDSKEEFDCSKVEFRLLSPCGTELPLE